MNRPVVLGICGGIASGKSLVSRMFKDLSAEVFDADEAAHRILDTPSLKEIVRKRWGKEVFCKDGTVDRSALAARVFADPEEIQALDRLIHPGVHQALGQFLEKKTTSRKNARVVLVLDVSLLVESGAHEACDYVVFVDADEVVREARAAHERAWQPGEIQKRQAHQASCENKKKLANFVISNNGTKKETLEQVKNIWIEIIEERVHAREDRNAPTPPER